MLHDSLATLFTHSKTVAGLIKLFFYGEALRQTFDFTTLEPVSIEVSELLKEENESYLTWRVRNNKLGWIYFFLIIRVDTTVEKLMAIRTMCFSVEVYRNLIGEDRTVRQSKYPSCICPIVIYKGDAPWDAPLHTKKLDRLDIPEKLRELESDQGYGYFILDLNHGFASTPKLHDAVPAD